MIVRLKCFVSEDVRLLLIGCISKGERCDLHGLLV